MQNHISIWQMAIDVCLVTSILVMAFRYAKSSRAQVLLPRIVELEGRISVLMAETEGRAKHLTDQLIRREQNLSKYITDIEKREKDMSLAVGEGEALVKELALLCEGARREAVELERTVTEGRDLHKTLQVPMEASRRGVLGRKNSPLSERVETEVVENPTFSTRVNSRRAEEWIEDVKEAGDRTQSSKPSQSTFRNLRDSYKAAEEMLKEGRDTEEVSEVTSIPLEGVKRLAQMIEIERDEHSDATARFQAHRPASDPRLGALGVSRRPSQPR